MRPFALVALVCSLVGCAEPEPDAALPDRLPVGWDAGVLMLPYQRSGDHSGGRGADLYPTAPMAWPSTCAAYRDEVRHERDSCTVRPAEYSWENESGWVASASWPGCRGGGWNGCPEGTYPDPYDQRLVAFDAAGRPVAWWNGTNGPHTVYSTE